MAGKWPNCTTKASRSTLSFTPWRTTIDAGHPTRQPVQASTPLATAVGSTWPGLRAAARIAASDRGEPHVHQKLRDSEQPVERAFAGFANNAGRDGDDAG